VGSVALTRNKWIKAQRFRADYRLYIAVGCKTEPQLNALQNPAAVLRLEEELEVVRYIVRAEAWQRYAQPVKTPPGGSGLTATRDNVQFPYNREVRDELERSNCC
jgi:hypothetical protein